MKKTKDKEIRRVAVILLHDDEKRILLQKREESRKYLAGFWAFFGGGIEDGETPEEAVRRETREELQMELSSPKMFEESSYDLEGLHVIVSSFLHPCFRKDGLILQEGADWGWFSLKDSESLKMLPHDREVFRRAMQIIS